MLQNLKGETLTPAERMEYLKIIEDDFLTCYWTGRMVHFFVSFMMEMFSPDRTQFFKTTKKGRTVYEAYLYTHRLQKTVRSSYYAQCWMNDEPFRSALLHRHCRNFVTAENNLDFATLFGKADAGIKKFNDVPLKYRPKVFKNETTNVPEAQLKTIFSNMKNQNRNSRIKKVKPLVCDFKNFQELGWVFGSQNSISTVMGLPNAKDKLSVDRTIIGDTVRYNWDVQIMGIRDNWAKKSMRFITESPEAMENWRETHPELTTFNNHQLVAHELRIRYCALLETYLARMNQVEEPLEDVGDYDVVRGDDFVGDILDGHDDDE